MELKSRGNFVIDCSEAPAIASMTIVKTSLFVPVTVNSANHNFFYRGQGKCLSQKGTLTNLLLTSKVIYTQLIYPV